MCKGDCPRGEQETAQHWCGEVLWYVFLGGHGLWCLFRKHQRSTQTNDGCPSSQPEQVPHLCSSDIDNCLSLLEELEDLLGDLARVLEFNMPYIYMHPVLRTL